LSGIGPIAVSVDFLITNDQVVLIELVLRLYLFHRKVFKLCQLTHNRHYSLTPSAGFSCYHWIAIFTDMSSVTSSCTVFNGNFSFCASDFIFSPLLRLRIVAYVRKPFHAKVKDVSWPIPLELPVTIATL